MKKTFLAGLMAMTMAASLLSGCGGTVVEEAPPSAVLPRPAAAQQKAEQTAPRPAALSPTPSPETRETP